MGLGIRIVKPVGGWVLGVRVGVPVGVGWVGTGDSGRLDISVSASRLVTGGWGGINAAVLEPSRAGGEGGLGLSALATVGVRAIQ